MLQNSILTVIILARSRINYDPCHQHWIDVGSITNNVDTKPPMNIYVQVFGITDTCRPGSIKIIDQSKKNDVRQSAYVNFSPVNIYLELTNGRNNLMVI